MAPSEPGFLLTVDGKPVLFSFDLEHLKSELRVRASAALGEKTQTPQQVYPLHMFPESADVQWFLRHGDIDGRALVLWRRREAPATTTAPTVNTTSGGWWWSRTTVPAPPSLPSQTALFEVVLRFAVEPIPTFGAVPASHLMIVAPPSPPPVAQAPQSDAAAPLPPLPRATPTTVVMKPVQVLRHRRRPEQAARMGWALVQMEAQTKVEERRRRLEQQQEALASVHAAIREIRQIRAGFAQQEAIDKIDAIQRELAQ